LLRYYIRLDDAHEQMNLKQWEELISLLDSFGIKAIIGVIPQNRDSEIISGSCPHFWKVVQSWQRQGHIIALHGLHHLKITSQGGIIPKNRRSEFAGVSYLEQQQKIQKALEIFHHKGFSPTVFIPPFHSFDKKTITVLRENGFRIIYDGIAFYPYFKYNILFFPQQYNKCIKQKEGIWTICLHPSTMVDEEFQTMRNFLQENRDHFVNDFFEVAQRFQLREENMKDRWFHRYYFFRRTLFLLKKRVRSMFDNHSV